MQLAHCAQAVRLMGTWSAAVAMVVVYIDDPHVDWPAYAWLLGMAAVAAWPVLAHCRPAAAPGYEAAPSSSCDESSDSMQEP